MAAVTSCGNAQFSKFQSFVAFRFMLMKYEHEGCLAKAGTYSFRTPLVFHVAGYFLLPLSKVLVYSGAGFLQRESV